MDSACLTCLESLICFPYVALPCQVGTVCHCPIACAENGTEGLPPSLQDSMHLLCWPEEARPALGPGTSALSLPRIANGCFCPVCAFLEVWLVSDSPHPPRQPLDPVREGQWHAAESCRLLTATAPSYSMETQRSITHPRVLPGSNHQTVMPASRRCPL